MQLLDRQGCQRRNVGKARGKTDVLHQSWAEHCSGVEAQLGLLDVKVALLALGFALGIVAGSVATWWLLTQGFDQTFFVHSVSSHYPHPGKNSETTLRVFVSGNTGHVKEILCLFPPEFQLNGSEQEGWSEIRKVRVGKVGEKYMFGAVGYFCERID